MSLNTALVSANFAANKIMLVPDDAIKDDKHRLGLFVNWLDTTNQSWSAPDLAAYRDWLLHTYSGRGGAPLSPTSVRTHLSTIRGRYEAILRGNDLRDKLYQFTQTATSAANKKAFVDEAITRLQNAIHADNAPVEVVTRQDRPDDEHLRLSTAQANALIAAPKVDSLIGLRDTAMIALMLCTGIREAELCALDVHDLRKRLGGELALHIRRGKGAKERLIPYGSLEWVLAILDVWLKAAGIENGAVFRGVYKGEKGSIRSTRLTVRAINQMLERYPIMIDGTLRVVNPHDLRRTYARRLYEGGVDVLAIRDNLGHADSKTTLNYIGTMSVDARKPPAIYRFNLAALSQVSM
jgi:site-specific recombinase XerD